MDLERGESGEAFIKVRPRAPFFMGQPRRHTFQVAYTRYSELNDPADPTVDGTLDGTFEQRPVASRRLLMVAALSVAALVALVALLPSNPTPASATVPPQTPQLTSVGAADPPASDALLIKWEADPTATGYRIDRLLTEGAEQSVIDSASVGGERNAHKYEGLEPASTHCFQLVALNDAGESDPTPAQCGETLAAAVSEAPTAPDGGASEPDGNGGGGGGASEPDGNGGGGGGGASEPDGNGGGGGGQPTDAPPGGTIEPQLAYVEYSATPLDDPANQQAAEQLVANLQAADINARLIDSRQSETFRDGLNDLGLNIVFQDGFESVDAARAHCNDPQVRELAPLCAASPPVQQQP
jgi:hypothetical protein